MVQRFDGEIVGSHAHRLRFAGAHPGDVELIDLPFLGAPGDEGASVRRRRDGDAREMDFVTLPGMLELEAWAQRQHVRRSAFGGGRRRHELSRRRGREGGHREQRHEDAIAHGDLLYLIWNSTGRSTHMATGSLPRRAGSKRHRRTASMAA